MNAPNTSREDLVEIRFKNTRKEFFRNSDSLALGVGDAVAVESVIGHDIGIVSLTGELVTFQMRKMGVQARGKDQKKVYRKATEEDINGWKMAQSLEHETMIKARKIVREMNLNMKISDVEYQGDRNRATFYYIADERIDFRVLIKVLADTFRVRVDMRQIGSRQEAGRVAGIGSCGRELCCSSWLTDFRSVTTSAARYQQLSINPMKLAGQCGKLKCCLNYELDSYLDALKDFPDARIKLKTRKGLAVHQKSDIFRGLMWYAYEESLAEFIPIKVDRVREVISLNQAGKAVDDLQRFMSVEEVRDEPIAFENVVGQEDVTRFDRGKPHGKKKRKSKNRRDRKGREKGKA